jgi:CBS domain-containing protein
MPSDLKAEDCMVRELVTVRPETDAYDAISLLLKHRISGMPVVDDSGKLVGVLSERDCLKTLFDAQYHNLPTALVKDLMSVELETIRPDTDVLKIAELFLQGRFRRLPVVDKGQLVGQVSRRDVLRVIQKMR